MRDIYQQTKKLLPQSLRKLFKPLYLKWSLRNFKQPELVVIPRYGFKIEVDPQNVAVDEYIYMHRNWETHIGELIAKELKAGDVFVDIGANIGYFSLLASGVVGVSGRVIAFEPIKRVAEQFSRSVAKNGFQNVQIRQIALGNEKAEMKLSIVPGNVGGSSLVKDINSGVSEMVSVSTLDSELNNIPVQVIKIDVEGFEYEVLLGAKSVLSLWRPTLLLEFSPNVYSRRDSQISQKILDIENRVPVKNVEEYLTKLGTKQTNLLAKVTIKD
jgi:FkbM family methyltransferase